MEHQIYKEWIPLAVDDELSTHEKAEFEKHLTECAECRVEYEEQKKLTAFLAENKMPEPDEIFLFENRQALRNAIRKERNRQNVWEKFTAIFAHPKFRLAFGGVGILFAGFFVGYLFFKQPVQGIAPVSGGTTMFQTASGKPISSQDSFSLTQNDIRISNVRFIDQDASDGEIEFIFDAIKPVRMKGNINDERIKNILTYAMLNTENPGVRLNSINALGADNKSKTDPKVKSSLISVAKFDQNPGVRREAIKLLNRFNTDEDVKNTLLYVLMNDKISGNRIEAINSLMQAQKEGTKFNEDELSIFKEKMKADDNKYIRYQAKTVLSQSAGTGNN